jgi:TolA-binding protein
MLELLSSLPAPSKPDSEWQKLHDSIISGLSNTTSNKIFKFKSASTWRIQAIAALLVLSVISIPIINHLIPNSKNVRVININGYAVSGISPVKAESKLSDGTELTTGNKSSIEISTDHSIISLGECTVFKIDSAKKDRQVFSLTKGNLAAKVSKRSPGQLFRIKTPNGYCEVVGTRFLVEVRNSTSPSQYRTRLIVQEGIVKFGNGKEMALVKAGDSAFIEGEHLYSGSACKIGDPAFIEGKHLYSGSAVKADCKTKDKQVPVTDSAVSKHLSITSEQIENEYQKANELFDCGQISAALALFKQISQDRRTSKQLQVTALNKAAACCKLLGDNTGAIDNYSKVINGDFSKDQKESALFQTALIKFNCIHDFEGAETALKTYMDRYPDGLWIEDAYSTLAELLFLSKKYLQAAQIYETFTSKFSNNRQNEKALYELACIYSRDLKDYRKAIATFSGLLEKYPNSQFAEDALFWSADCRYNQGLISESIKTYENYLSRFPKGKWASEARIRLYKKESAGVAK